MPIKASRRLDPTFELGQHRSLNKKMRRQLWRIFTFSYQNQIVSKLEIRCETDEFFVNVPNSKHIAFLKKD
jgi:hypothetical protein